MEKKTFKIEEIIHAHTYKPLKPKYNKHLIKL